jgi:hypothetical protein
MGRCLADGRAVAQLTEMATATGIHVIKQLKPLATLCGLPSAFVK